jgi:hypothetical protein
VTGKSARVRLIHCAGVVSLNRLLDAMTVFDPRAYGPVLAPLLAIDRRRELDAGRPDADAADALKTLTADSAFAHVPSDAEMAACCVAGVWLLHDYLDESHTISQGIDTPSGRFWHAIMHRREGDFSNAKYWFRHVGQHPVYESLGQRAAEMAAVRGAESAIKKLTTGGAWDPFAFVDLCQAVARGKSDARELCLDIQQAEWELLFDYCYREAVDV